MPKITIDEQEIEVEDGITVIQACDAIGIDIPRFCYHEKLKIAGNCRMCLVEMERAPKPVASCSTTVNEGMVIRTNTAKIKKARSGVMEFLLINHPLDCPICDQGGECDLQDQAFKYGDLNNRYNENKRAVKDKYIGPLIKTHMTRCIHCTRCVRFAQDVAGIEELGAVGRGEHMEITTYLEKALTSEMSGNMIDLCPVGALNSKPYEYKARSWELKKTESIDVMDAVGSNIRVDSRSLEIMRILPKANEDINEEWISDKTRFSYDGLKYQRLDKPYIRIKGKLVATSWKVVLAELAKKIEGIGGEKIGAVAGDLTDCETMFVMKKLLTSIGSKNMDFNQRGYEYDLSKKGNYLFNTTISEIDRADLCLLVGANPREVAPIINTRIGKNNRFNNLHIARIGQPDDQTYKIEELGEESKIIEQILSGKHAFAKKLKAAKNPMIIIGDAILARSDSLPIQQLLYDISTKYGVITKDWNGYNILHNNASTVGAIEMGFAPQFTKGKSVKQMLKSANDGELKVLFLLGADEIETESLKGCLKVYIGHHGDKSAHYADFILPSAAYTEKNATYINLEGRAQETKMAVQPPFEAKADAEIISNVAKAMGFDLALEDYQSLRKEISKQSAAIEDMNNVIASEVSVIKHGKKDIKDTKIQKIPMDFYLTNVINRASVTMAKCSELRKELV